MYLLRTMTGMILQQYNNPDVKWFWNIDNSICLNLYIVLYIFFCPSTFRKKQEIKINKLTKYRANKKRRIYISFTYAQPKSNLWLCSMKIEQTKCQQQLYTYCLVCVFGICFCFFFLWFQWHACVWIFCVPFLFLSSLFPGTFSFIMECP